MGNNRGLTLVEIIIAVALLGVIAIGVIPAFTSQILVLNQGKTLTTGAFNAQGIVEEAIQDVQSRIQKLQPLDTVDGLTTVQRSFWGRTVNMNRLVRVFPENENKTIFVYLSRRLAEIQKSALLTVNNVRIDVSGTADDSIADMRLTPQPSLNGLFDDNSAQTGFFTNLFTWYVSNEGIADPQFPADYTPLSFPGIDPQTINDLLTLAGANRYVMLEVTPVDIHGLRGDPVSSNNRVLVLGQEWRSGTFPWIDKNNNGNLEGTDLPLTAAKIQETFDSHLTFPNPANPSDTLNPADGALYVPMRVEPSAGAIAVSGAETINWLTDRSIHLAKDIAVGNSTDIVMKARDGNITLYQYALLDGSGNPLYGADGKVRTINDGPNLNTGGDIYMETLGRGMVGINDYAWLEGDDLTFIANSQMYMKRATLKASEDILLDTSRNIGIPGNRDLMLDDMVVELKNNSTANRTIQLKSRNAITANDTEFRGNPSQPSSMAISAKGDISLTGALFSNLNVSVDNHATLLGGGWSSGKVFSVPSGKTLTLGARGGRVSNLGTLSLGDTGAVDFVTSMPADLQRPLTLSLAKGSDSTVVISTDYGRNVAYADARNMESVASAGSYQSLGGGQVNLAYTADQTAASIPNLQSLTYAFDGNNTITIEGQAGGPVSASVILKVKDLYADNEVEGAIQFAVSASGPGPATITVLEPIVPVYVTGIAVSSPANEIYAGETLQMTASVTPANATNKTVTWSVTVGANAATVNSSGLLTGVLPGSAYATTVTVRATANDGTLVYGEKTITVRPPLVVLGAPGNVQLSDVGLGTWNAVANASGYRLQLIKDGTAFGTALDVPASPISHSFLQDMRAGGGGSYSFSVLARGDGVTYSNGPASLSGARLVSQLNTVTNLTWNTTREWAQWGNVPNEGGYRIQLYKNGQPAGSAVTVPANTTTYDFTNLIDANGSGVYQFTVVATGGTGTLYIDSAESALSGNYSAVVIVREWTFSSNNAEGWTAGNHVTGFGTGNQGGVGYLLGNIQNVVDADPYLHSGDNLGTGISNAKTIEVRMRNSSSSTTAQIYFITTANGTWDEVKRKNFDITDNQTNGYTTYTIDMSDVPGWTGTLRRLRLDPAVGGGGGSFRIDRITIY